MSTVGQVERKTQQRVVKLFRDTLGYDYLGDWSDEVGNSNIERSSCGCAPGPMRAPETRSCSVGTATVSASWFRRFWRNGSRF